MSGSDFLKQGFGGQMARLAADMESSLARSRKGAVEEASTYTPSDTTQWADPPPTTIAEALDRLAKAGATNTWPA